MRSVGLLGNEFDVISFITDAFFVGDNNAIAVLLNWGFIIAL